MRRTTKARMIQGASILRLLLVAGIVCAFAVRLAPKSNLPAFDPHASAFNSNPLTIGGGCSLSEWVDTPWLCAGDWWNPGSSSGGPFGGGGGGGLTCAPDDYICQSWEEENPSGGGTRAPSDPIEPFWPEQN